MEGRAALAQQSLAQDPFCGTVLVFRAKRADRVKILFWDGSGLALEFQRAVKKIVSGSSPIRSFQVANRLCGKCAEISTFGGVC